MTAPWTADDIPDQSGRTAVVTGANSGLGLVTTLELARAGATVLMACRNLEKGAAAADQIRESVPNARVEVVELDLSSLDSVRQFADALDVDELDLLVNNAGIMWVPQQRSDDGFELQFGTNHLGHFALTGLLLARLNRCSSTPRGHPVQQRAPAGTLRLRRPPAGAPLRRPQGLPAVEARQRRLRPGAGSTPARRRLADQERAGPPRVHRDQPSDRREDRAHECGDGARQPA